MMLPRIVRAAAGRRLLSTYPTAPERLSSLRAMIANPPGGDVVRVLEVHSGLCGLIAETARGPNGEAFDATWSSSLTSSAIKGKPDIETVDTSARIGQVEDVLEVSTKPMIYDGDTGGLPEIFHFTVRSLERLGVSACIIEDKTGLKQNSLFGTDRKQQLEDIDSFCAKISAGKAAQVTDDFMVIARMESLIAGYGAFQRTQRSHSSSVFCDRCMYLRSLAHCLCSCPYCMCWVFLQARTRRSCAPRAPSGPAPTAS